MLGFTSLSTWIPFKSSGSNGVWVDDANHREDVQVADKVVNTGGKFYKWRV